MKLSIVCITKAEAFAAPLLEQMRAAADELGAELVIAQDGGLASDGMVGKLAHSPVGVSSQGYVESVLDEVLEQYVEADYVLRLDDDESISPAMLAWLKSGEYEKTDVWAFPRAHLWGSAKDFIVDGPLFPDLQTRLTIHSKAGGRRGLHAGSPYGTGKVAPVLLLHHKFLVRSLAEREALAERYDQVKAGGGTGLFMPYNLPEQYFNELHLAAVEDGRCPYWNDRQTWHETRSLS